jgi:hypothetical protein
MSRGLVCALLVVLIGACASPVGTQSDDKQVASTLSVYQSLSAGIVTGVLARMQVPDSSHVQVRVEPAGSFWYIEEALEQAVRQRGLVPVATGGTWQIECGVKDARVRYADVRREGLLGRRVVDRTTILVLWMRVNDVERGAFVVDQECRAGATDTIGVDDIEAVEHPGIAATHGILPPESLFASWLEPLILVGAIGVAVVLLFTTRS